LLVENVAINEIQMMHIPFFANKPVKWFPSVNCECKTCLPQRRRVLYNRSFSYSIAVYMY